MSVQNRIFTDEDWAKLYNSNLYKQVAAGKVKNDRVKACFVHYILAAPQSDATVIGQIENIKGVGRLTLPDTDAHHLTPLAIACMQGRKEVVAALIKKIRALGGTSTLRSSLNAPDTYGWTPLHHARISSESIFEMLKAAGANVSCRTKLGGSCDDIRALTTLEADVREGRSVCIELNTRQRMRIREISAATLEALTGLKGYRDGVYYAPEHWKDLWMMSLNQQDYLTLFPEEVERRYKRMLESPPQLVIAENQHLAPLGVATYELRAAETILPGQFIVEYGGIYQPKGGRMPRSFVQPMSNEPYDAYYLSRCTALHYGNAARFANTGFSNAACLTINQAGAPRLILIAVQKIEAGEAIQMMYGLKDNTGWRIEYPLRAAAMKAHFQALRTPGGIVKEARLRQQFADPNHTYSQEVECIGALLATSHPAMSPTIMLYLHYSALYDIDQSISILGKMDMYRATGAFAIQAFMLAWLVKACRTSVARYNPAMRQAVADAVLAQIGTRPLAAVIKFICFVKDCPTGWLTPELMGQKAAELKTYDPMADPDFPFAYKNAGDAMHAYFMYWLESDQTPNRASLLGSTYNLCEDMALSLRSDSEVLRTVQRELRRLEEGLSATDIQKARSAAEEVLKRPLGAALQK